MTNITRAFAESERGPSPIVFRGGLTQLKHQNDVGVCMLVWDDFQTAPVHASAAASGGYYTYQDTGVTIQGATGPPNLGSADNKAELGVLEVAGNDADNDEGHTQFGYGGPFRIGNSASNTGKVLFEARIKKASVADNGVGIFIGLGTGPVATNYLVDDTAELIATKGFIGFQGLNDDGNQLDVVYQAASQTKQTVLANAVTLTADEYVKVGFRYDPTMIDAAKKIQFYADGVLLDADVSTTNIDAATFPEDEALVPMMLTKVGTAAESKVQLDWVCAAQFVTNRE